MKRNWTTPTTIALTAAIVIVVNWIGLNWFFRLDLTDDNVYSLSQASIETVENLRDPVTFKAFFTEDLPAPYSANRRFLKDKLDEYRAYGRNMVQYDFVDPVTDEGLRTDAERYRIPPVQIQVVENDNLQIKNAFMGLAIQYRDEREVIGVVQDLESLEYEITTAIRKMQRDRLPLVGFLQGHGEPDPTDRMQTLLREMRRRLDVRTVQIEEGRLSPQPDVLFVVAPVDSFPADHLTAIDAFVQRGGKAAFLLNRVEADIQQGFGMPVETGLSGLLSSYGIEVNQDLVMDEQSSTINVQRQAGMFQVIEAVEYPFLPIATSFSDNSMVNRLSQLRTFFVSSIDTSTTPPGVYVEPLVFSSPRSALQTGFFMLRPEAVASKSLEDGPFVLAAAYTGDFESPYGLNDSTSTRLVAVGDGDLVDEALTGPIPSNIEFVLNMVDWLELDEDVLAIRAKKIDPRPLDPVSEELRTPVKYAAMLLPPFLVVVAGLIRWRLRGRRSSKA